ncbi:choice-of-anchor B family protein [Bowmanella denitrificans]|uniref:choice-of-anchor B family protein n=1 Tax=Bowmanella denitrificans TaxID=366582 RepID=UPI001559F7C1|nr:choice-of-anchor B family protein [Bowmanella denitrificans]
MRPNILSMMLVCALFSQGALSHSEHDKARFVAENGQDLGLCDNRLRPCRTIAYAVSRANKGDRVLVAQGRYQIQSQEDLLALLGNLVSVTAGYNRIDLYQSQAPDTHLTFISGVPKDYLQQLSSQGFVPIQDQHPQPDQPLQQKLQRLASLNSQQSAQSCVDGRAGNYACNNVDLVGHLPLTALGNPSSANDIWGHVDLNSGIEYALIGLANGVAVVSLADASAPVLVGRISGQSTIWRDIKVYQYFDSSAGVWRAYAYATADGASEGLSIIDLNQLPAQVSLVKRQMLHGAAHNLYISQLDYSLNIALGGHTPLLHISGASNRFGALHGFSLANPTDLTLDYASPSASRSDYSHDAASLTIDDERADSQCQADPSGCLVMLDFNENEFRLWQYTDKVVSQLSQASYANAEYVHSGWWSEDKRYMLVHDELDERRLGLNTTLRVFDISDLSNPRLAATWTGPTRATDHNGFVRGNRYYMSNYERGLTILDISDANSPKEVGFFDTFPASDQTSFNGAWGVYPFLPSGLILVSDVNSGLYILRDNSKQVALAQIGFASDQLQSEEGQSLTLAVQLQRNAPGLVEVGYETLPGSATSQDFSALAGRLSWDTNNSDSQHLNLQILADSLDDEPQESFFVRLFDPRNGATLGQSLARINISGKAPSGLIAFAQTELSLLENQQPVNVSVVRSGGSAGALSVSYQLNSQSAQAGEDIVAASGTLHWQDGDNTPRSIVLSPINDNLSESTENLELVLTALADTRLAEPSRLLISLLDDDSNRAPNVNAGADMQVNTRAVVNVQSASALDDQADLNLVWQQTAGPQVELTSNGTITRFVAPGEAALITLTLTATDPFGASGSDSLNIQVVAPAPPPASNNSGGSGGGALGILLLLALGGMIGLDKRRRI